MKAWLDSLAPRERLALLVGATVLLAMVLYAAVWHPFATRHARLAQVVGEQRELLAWMEATAAQMAELRARDGGGGRPGLAQGQSLLTVVDTSTRAAAIAGQVTRVQPEGADGVRVWLDKVAFARLIAWLTRLQLEAAVDIESITVEPAERPGEVNARIGLRRPGAAPA
jgi:general secretion pathway protein M